MALRGGNAKNSGSARSSAKFEKAPRKAKVHQPKGKPFTMEGLEQYLPKEKAKEKAKGKPAKKSKPSASASPSTAMSKGAKKARSKMVGGKGRYTGPKSK